MAATAPAEAGGPSSSASSLREIDPSHVDTSGRRLSHGRPPLVGDSDDDSIADERTALLSASAGGNPHPSKRRRGCPSLKRVVCGLVIAILVLVFTLLIFLHVLVGHLYTRRLHDRKRIREYGRRALVLDGPHSLRIDRFDDRGVHATVGMRAGVDVSRAFEGEPPLDVVERHLIRYGLVMAPTAYISMPHGVTVRSMGGDDLIMLPAGSIADVSVPVRWRPEGDWLQDLELPLDIRISDADAVAAFVNVSWTRRRADVNVICDGVQVRIGDSIHLTHAIDLAERLGSDLPSLPGLDTPSDLVDLQSYTIAPLVDHQLGLTARATVTNPLSNATLPPLIQRVFDLVEDQELAMPWRLPFSVAIRDGKHSEISMARVAILPFTMDDGIRQAQVNLSLSGTFARETNASNAALSTFLARFLLGLDNPVVVQYLPSDMNHHRAPPAFLGPLLEPYAVKLRFPGAADDQRKLLEDVQIENMRISLGGGTADLLASGKIAGRLRLPAELAGLADADALAISAVMPDVYVYAGAPPRNREGGSVPGDGRPPASNAFARLSSESYLPATTERIVDADGRNVTLVRAELKDAPLDLLAGRGDVFRRYIGKVLLGSGDGPEGKVKTGVRGIVAVNATIEGFGHVELNGLPVEGEFYVGRQDARMLALSQFLHL